MDHPNFTTSHEKNTHLKYNHRVINELQLKDGHTAYKTAKEFRCAANTVRNEIKKGTVNQLEQGRLASLYYADAGQRVYDANHNNCIKNFKRLQVSDFINHVTEMMQQDTKWSVAVCVGEAIASSERYDRSEMVCSFVQLHYGYKEYGLTAKIEKNYQKSESQEE